MARPVKQGLDYFPIDVDFFQDEKIAVIAGEFGLKGEIVIIKLLCAVYRNGYFVEWSEMLKYKLLKELPGVSADLLEQIVKRLVKWGFFDKTLFDSASILTSHGIQRRYQAISTKMHRKNTVELYSLLVDSNSKLSSVQSPLYSPDSKKSPPIGLNDSIKNMSADTAWCEGVCTALDIKPDAITLLLANFEKHCLLCGKHYHENLADAKRHFASWYESRRQPVSTSQHKPAKPKNDNRSLTQARQEFLDDFFEASRSDAIAKQADNLGLSVSQYRDLVCLVLDDWEVNGPVPPPTNESRSRMLYTARKKHSAMTNKKALPPKSPAPVLSPSAERNRLRREAIYNRDDVLSGEALARKLASFSLDKPSERQALDDARNL